MALLAQSFVLQGTTQMMYEGMYQREKMIDELNQDLAITQAR